ncbi:MAG: helix-turn-helix domain-containing protein [Enterococcus sp.]
MTTYNKKAVGERIRSIRIGLGYTMEAFGEKLDTSKGAVNNWEKGKSLPNKPRLKKIADLGGVSITYLLEGKRTFIDHEDWELNAGITDTDAAMNTLKDFLRDRVDPRYLESLSKDELILLQNTFALYALKRQGKISSLESMNNFINEYFGFFQAKHIVANIKNGERVIKPKYGSLDEQENKLKEAFNNLLNS